MDRREEQRTGEVAVFQKAPMEGVGTADCRNPGKSVTAAAAVTAWRHASWVWLIVALYAHGTVCGFMINAVHELVHGTVFRTRWLNQVLVHFFAFVGWINHYAYWASHSEHHKFTLHGKHDGEVVLPVTFHFRTFLAAFTLDPAKLREVVHESFRLAQGKIDDPWLRQVLHGEQRRFGAAVLADSPASAQTGQRTPGSVMVAV